MIKKIADSLFSKIKSGGVKVRYWDGDVATYGPDAPRFTLIIHDKSALFGMARHLTLGFGEAYMDGKVDIEGPLEQVHKFAIDNQPAFERYTFWQLPRLRLPFKHDQAKQVQHHYDIGNDFYKLWLDDSLTYSCAYFKKKTDGLEQAQEQKVDYLLKKLHLQKGHQLLDIGSGWGHLVIKAARKYQVKGMGITLSKNQLKLSKQLAKEAGVEDLVTFKLMNYQDLPERVMFDRIISVGMFEHVGQGNHADYFAVVNKHLREGGVSVLHTITQQKERATSSWIDRYIFPGGYIPSARETVWHLPNHNLRLVDYENLRLHYAMTLDEWWRRFEANKQKVIDMYDERFYRMWRLWLSGSAASFRYGMLDLSQLIFTKGYTNELPLTREGLYR